MKSKLLSGVGAAAAACVVVGIAAIGQSGWAVQSMAGHAIASPAAMQTLQESSSASTSTEADSRGGSTASSEPSSHLGNVPDLSVPVASSSTGQQTVPATEETPRSTTPEERTTVAFIGDSYTNGTGASDHSKRWTDLVSAARGWEEVNLGAGGTGYITVPTSPEKACGRSSCPNYVAQAQQAVLIDPQIVIVSGGRNDLTAVAHDPDRVRTAVDRVLATLRSGLPQARIIVISPFWDSSTPSSRISELAGWLQSAAVKNGADFIPDAAQYLIGRPDAIWHDGVHPNDLGYSIIAERVDEALVTVLGPTSRTERESVATESTTAPPTVPPMR